MRDLVLGDNAESQAGFRNETAQITAKTSTSLQLSVKYTDIAVVATPLRELTCHMGSHSVTCHPAEVTFPPLPQPKLVLD